MSALIAGVLWAGVGLGAAVAMLGLRGHRLTRPAWISRGKARTERWRQLLPRRAAVAVLTAVGVSLVTGWLAAGLLSGLAIGMLPHALGGQKARKVEVARTEAIAAWTEMVRGSIAAAAGVEEAIVATGHVAPEAIRDEVRALVGRLDHQPLPDALTMFGEDLQHPSADMVVAALVLAVRLEASDLSGLLTRLATATREDARMRVRVETSRARIRTGGKIIVAVTAATVALLFVADRGYLEAYDDAAGQVVLLICGGCFAGGGWLLARMARIELPDRLHLRTSAFSGEEASL